MITTEHMRGVDTALAYASYVCLLVGFVIALAVLRGAIVDPARRREEMARPLDVWGRTGLWIIRVGIVFAVLRIAVILLWPLLSFCPC